jgi:basic amino acid/polyamine antiporter, APA family
MIGAGVFAAFGPAAAAAGSGMLPGLVVAGAVASCNAWSSARLAARYPESGGTYVYGRERLGPFWGYLAGWAFVVGKVASCAAMALTFAAYAAPSVVRPVAVAAVVAVVGVNLAGVRKTSRATSVIVAAVLLALAVAVTSAAPAWRSDALELGSMLDAGAGDILRSAGFLFFAFAGYARIATLGEEVRDPARTIPRAMSVALAITLAVYLVVAVATLGALGPARLGASDAPLADAARASSAPWVSVVVRAGGAVAALGVLVSLVAGVGRTAYAMGAAGDLPSPLGAVDARRRIPHVATAAVGAAVTLAVLAFDVRRSIGFSAFTVLGYYAITNVVALTLPRSSARQRVGAVVGVAGCAALCASLPGSSVTAGLAVLGAGVALWFSGGLGGGVRPRRRGSGRTPGRLGRSPARPAASGPAAGGGGRGRGRTARPRRGPTSRAPR